MGKFSSNYGPNYQRAGAGVRGGSNSPQRAIARLNYLQSLRNRTKKKRRYVIEMMITGSIVSRQETPITASVRSTKEIKLVGKVVQTHEIALNSAVIAKQTLKLRGLVLKDGVVQRGREEALYLARKLLGLWVLYKVRKMMKQ